MLSYKFLFFFTDFLEIQRKSFYLFLNELLSQEFLKIQPLWFRKNPIYKNLKFNSSGGPFSKPSSFSNETFSKKNRNHDHIVDFSYKTLTNFKNKLEGSKLPPISSMTTNDRITTIYFLSKNYKFIQPTLNIEESILFSKTYCCHFYMPVKVFDHSTNFTEIGWIFLGTLPLLTRRGHFIINGTPRIILNQIIRSSGIYFHKETTEEKKNSRLFYAEIISKSGPWVRLEIDQKKRIWVSFQQSGITRIALSHFFQNFYQKYLDHHIFLNEKKKKKLNFDAILFNEFFWKDVIFQEPKNKGFEKNIQIYPNINLTPSTFLGQKKTFQRGFSQFQKLWIKLKPFKIYSHDWSQNLSPLFSSKKYPIFNWSLFIYLKFKFIPLIGNQFKNPIQKYKNTKSSAQKTPRQASLKALRRACLARSLLNRQMFHSSVQQFQKQKSELKYRNHFGSDILFASSSKNTDLGFNLGQSGRIRLNQRLGLSLNTFTLTPIDFLAISDILYGFVKGQRIRERYPLQKQSSLPFHSSININSIDDIDDLKNRRLKTIGELLQNQFARGLQRLRKTFENTVQKDWIKFLNHQIYNSSLSFLNSFNWNRKKSGILLKRSFTYQPSSNKTIHSIPKKPFSQDHGTQHLQLASSPKRGEGGWPGPRPPLAGERGGLPVRVISGQASLRGEEARRAESPIGGREHDEAQGHLLPQTPFRPLDPILKCYFYTEKKEVFLRPNFIQPREGQAIQKTNTFGGEHSNDSNILKKHIFEKRIFYLQQIRKLNIFKNHSNALRGTGVEGSLRSPHPESQPPSAPLVPFGTQAELASGGRARPAQALPFGYRLHLLTSLTQTPQKHSYSLLTKLHFKRNYIWKELLFYHKNNINGENFDPDLANQQTQNPFLSSASIFSIINSLPMNSTLKEFFHSHQLSQFLDQSNPLAEITHKRRFSCLGSGGITRETAGMEIRGIHLSHYGRICPIETPEGKNAGLVNSLTTTVHVNNQGFLETPYVEIYKQHYQNQKKLMFFSVEDQEIKNVFLNPKLPKLRNISVGIIKPQTQNFYKFKIHFLNLVALNPQQFLSIATTCIPFIEHDDANRALMGSNMQRQALPLIHLEQPIVTTFNAFRVLSDLKDIPTTSNSGIILYVSQQKISYYRLNFKKKGNLLGHTYKNLKLQSRKLLLTPLKPPRFKKGLSGLSGRGSKAASFFWSSPRGLSPAHALGSLRTEHFFSSLFSIVFYPNRL